MTNRNDVIGIIAYERRRQELLKKEGKFAYTCASPEMTNAERLTVLGEELGEVAHEVNEGIGEGRRVNLDKLKNELIQCAAVAVAWIEAHGVPLEGALNRLESAIEERPDPEPLAVVRFAHLSHYYSVITNDVVLELAAIDGQNYAIPNLAAFAGFCAQWVEVLP